MGKAAPERNRLFRAVLLQQSAVTNAYDAVERLGGSLHSMYSEVVPQYLLALCAEMRRWDSTVVEALHEAVERDADLTFVWHKFGWWLFSKASRFSGSSWSPRFASMLLATANGRPRRPGAWSNENQRIHKTIRHEMQRTTQSACARVAMDWADAIALGIDQRSWGRAVSVADHTCLLIYETGGMERASEALCSLLNSARKKPPGHS